MFSNKPEKRTLVLTLCDLQEFLPLNFSGVPFLMCMCSLMHWIFKRHLLQISRILFLCSLFIFGILPWSLLRPWPPSSVFSTQESARTVLGSFHYAVSWGNHGVCLIYLRSLSCCLMTPWKPFFIPFVHFFFWQESKSGAYYSILSENEHNLYILFHL